MHMRSPLLMFCRLFGSQIAETCNERQDYTTANSDAVATLRV